MIYPPQSNLRWQTPALLLLALLLAFFCVVGGRTLRYGDFSALIGFGCLQQEAPGKACLALSNAALLPEHAVVYRTGGYDGQFYYYIAATLIDSKFQPAESAAVLDDPDLRWSRIGLPLLTAWAYELGGPRALMLAMVFVPLLVHLLAVLYFWHQFRRRAGAMSLLALTLNPVWLVALSLGLADGLALDLACLALFCFWRRKHNSLAAHSWPLLLTLAILTKETMLLCWPLFALWLTTDRLAGQRVLARTLYSLVQLACAPLLVLGWWLWIGYDPGATAAHGDLPLVGYVQYLQDPDAFWSGRGLLGWIYALLLLAVPLIVGRLSLIALRAWRRADQHAFLQRIYLWPHYVGLGRGALGMGWLWLSSVFLISLASAHEYWQNFANIVRLFGPASLLIVLLMRPTMRCSRPANISLALWLLGMALSVWVLQDVWRSNLLAYWILPG